MDFKKASVVAIGVLMVYVFNFLNSPAHALTPNLVFENGEAWLIDGSLQLLRVDSLGASVSESNLSTYGNLGQTAVDGDGAVWTFDTTSSPYASFNSQLIKVTPSYLGANLSTATTLSVINSAKPGHGYNLTSIAVGPNNDIWMAGYSTADDVDYSYEIIRLAAGTSTFSFFELPCLDLDLDCSGNAPGSANSDTNLIYSLVVSNEGDVFGSDLYNSRVYRLDFTNRNYAAIPTIAVLDANDGLDEPFTVFIDNQDDLWVTNADFTFVPFAIGSNTSVLRVDLSAGSFGAITTYPIGAGVAPVDIVVTPLGEVIVALYDHNVGKNIIGYDLLGTPYAVEIELSAPFKFGISLDQNNQVIAASSHTGNMYVVTNPQAETIQTYSLNLATASEKLGGDFNGYQQSIIADSSEISLNESANIAASVDPTIAMTLNTASCAIGVLSTSAVNGCEVVVTTSTNASSGYVLSVYDLNNGILQREGGNGSIPAVISSPISAGVAAYGVSTDAAGQAIVQTTNCNTTPSANTAAASALTTERQSMGSASVPVENDVTTLCVSASISELIPAGSYADMIVITAVGYF